MLQRLEIIISGKGPDFTVLLNGTSFKARDGVLTIEDMESLKPAERSIYAFDDEVGQVINEEERKVFYELILNCTGFGIISVMRTLEVGRDEAKDIIGCAVKHKVVFQHYSQWRLNKDVKEQVRAFAKLNENIAEASRSMQELMEDNMDELKMIRQSKSKDEDE